MFGEKKIHIVSFDVPYPADYGGVIDVSARLRALVLAGYEITLHCFEYGRGRSEELEALVSEVHYYKRKSLFCSLFSFLPMIVKSRENTKLLHNLLKDNAPILFEGQHTTAFLNNESLHSRFKIVRLHNVEHDYYKGLAESEKNWWKKMFFYLESFKLKKYDHKLSATSVLCAISEKDKEYYERVHSKVLLLPIANDLEIRRGSDLGSYVLFHGNFSVSENEFALRWFLEGAQNELPFEMVVAGKEISLSLEAKLKTFSNLKFYNSPSDEEMKELIGRAKVHLLVTFQNTGVKQKLINVVASNGAVVANSLMVDGTHLAKYCTIGESHDELTRLILNHLNTDVRVEDLKLRHEFLESEYGFKKQVEILEMCFSK